MKLDTLFVVTDPTDVSILADLVAEVSPVRFAHMVHGIALADGPRGFERMNPAVYTTKPEAMADARARLARRDAAESPRSSGDGSPEPFCACGRRLSECDGSRRGCRLGKEPR